MGEQLSPCPFPEARDGPSPARLLDKLVWIMSTLQRNAAVMSQWFAEWAPPSPLPDSMYCFLQRTLLLSTTALPSLPSAKLPPLLTATAPPLFPSTDARDDHAAVAPEPADAAAPAASTPVDSAEAPGPCSQV